MLTLDRSKLLREDPSPVIVRGIAVFIEPQVLQGDRPIHHARVSRDYVAGVIREGLGKAGPIDSRSMYTFIFRDVPRQIKVPLEIRPAEGERDQVIGVVSEVLHIDAFPNPADFNATDYVLGLNEYLNGLVARSAQERGYAMVYEVAQTSFFKRVIENGEVTTTHEIIDIHPA